ncbi:YjcZ family sporulation protein [Sporosarcina ureae]
MIVVLFILLIIVGAACL